MPEHGNQSKETPRDVYRAGISLLGSEFDRLSPEQQDQKLEAIQTTPFFELLRSHTIEGMFCDPLHGGNAGMIGWKTIDYPGPLMSHRGEIEKYRGIDYPKHPPKSLEQIAGRPVRGWEEER